MAPVHEMIAYELGGHDSMQPPKGVDRVAVRLGSSAKRSLRSGCERFIIQRSSSGPIAAGWSSVRTARGIANRRPPSASILQWRLERWHSSCTRTIASAGLFRFDGVPDHMGRAACRLRHTHTTCSRRALRHRPGTTMKPGQVRYQVGSTVLRGGRGMEERLAARNPPRDGDHPANHPAVRSLEGRKRSPPHLRMMCPQTTADVEPHGSDYDNGGTNSPP